jgi:hypothetical protein
MSRQRVECGRESDELPLSMTHDPEKLQQAGALHTLREIRAPFGILESPQSVNF